MAMPFIAHAQDFSRVNGFILAFGNIVDILMPILVMAALLFFIWGITTFFMTDGDDESRHEAKSRMIWGIVALFVVVSIWGITGFISRALEIKQGGRISPPGVADEGAPKVDTVDVLNP